MTKDKYTSFMHDDETEAELQEIAYYIKTSQPPGLSEPTRSDAVRYAIHMAAANIRNERRPTPPAEYEGEGVA